MNQNRNIVRKAAKATTAGNSLKEYYQQQKPVEKKTYVAATLVQKSSGETFVVRRYSLDGTGGGYMGL